MSYKGTVKRCITCGKEFDVLSATHKYCIDCSPSSKYLKEKRLCRVEVKKECPECKAIFYTHYERQKFCSKRCSDLTVKRNKELKDAVKFWLYSRDGFRCVYCGRTPMEHNVSLCVEHVLPRCFGGENSYYNVVSACTDCNFQKGNGILPLNQILQIWDRNKKLGVKTPYLSANEILKVFNEVYDLDVVYDIKEYFNITHWDNFKDIDIVKQLRNFQPILFK